jgi:dGTPase
LNILPDEYRFDYEKCPYQSILSIVKYVIGMTDNYAVDVYRKLNGIEIPNY